MVVRSMHIHDAEIVQSIDTQAADYPWTLGHFLESIEGQNECYVLLSNTPDKNAQEKDDQKLCGFAIFSRVADETSLLNIAIAPAYQARGLGRYLLDCCLKAQFELGAARCFLEVRVSNKPAQALYLSMGFSLVGERKNYYPSKNDREHALVMSCDLDNYAS